MAPVLDPTRLKVRSLLVADLSAAEYSRCLYLNLRNGGTMRDTLQTARYYCKQGQDKGSRVVLIEDGEQLLAWALIYRSFYQSNDVHFYVRRAFRRRGLGRMLMREVRRYTRKPRVQAWNEVAEAFFASFRGLHVS